jgi:hypothetical protein
MRCAGERGRHQHRQRLRPDNRDQPELRSGRPHAQLPATCRPPSPPSRTSWSAGWCAARAPAGKASGQSPLHDVKMNGSYLPCHLAGNARRRNFKNPEYASRRSTLPDDGGARRDRTDDLLLAKQALSQLSYGPSLTACVAGPKRMVGLGRLELPTSRLSGVRSNHLSYRPETKRAYAHIREERETKTAESRSVWCARPVTSDRTLF